MIIQFFKQPRPLQAGNRRLAYRTKSGVVISIGFLSFMTFFRAIHATIDIIIILPGFYNRVPAAVMILKVYSILGGRTPVAFGSMHFAQAFFVFIYIEVVSHFFRFFLFQKITYFYVRYKKGNPGSFKKTPLFT